MASTSSPSTSKRKHRVLTLQTKLDILSKLDKGETGVSLARLYDVGKATITDIKKNRDEITSFASKMDSGDSVKRRKTMKSAQNEDLDKAVAEWLIQRRSLGEPISGAQLCEKALDLNKKLGGPSDFKASSGWLQKFQARHGIRELQVYGKASSANFNAAEKFKETFQRFLDEEGFARDDVYNADWTGLNWKSLPRKSLPSQQQNAAQNFRSSEQRVTVMTSTNAAGTHRLPLLVIGEDEKPRCFKNITSLPVTYKSGKGASMDSKLFCNWYTNDFMNSVKEWRQAEGKHGRVLLLLDDTPPHLSARVLNAFDQDFVVMLFPPNMRRSIQTLGQSVIGKLKRMYREQILRRLLLAEDSTDESVISFSESLNLKHCCYILADAWKSITDEDLRTAWNKLWPSSAEPDQGVEEENLDGDRNDPTEFVELFNSIPGFTDCDKDDAVDWINSDGNEAGFRVMEDDGIVSSLTNGDENHDTSNSSSDENLGACEDPSNAEAFTAFETGLEWYEKQEECSPAEILVLKRLRDLAAKKLVSALRQHKVVHLTMKNS